MSRNRDMFVEIRFMGFPVKFPTTPKTCRSYNGSERYLKKTLKNDLRQSVRFTNFDIGLEMSNSHDKFVDIRFVGFTLKFPITPKRLHSDIASS